MSAATKPAMSADAEMVPVAWVLWNVNGRYVVGTTPDAEIARAWPYGKTTLYGPDSADTIAALRKDAERYRLLRKRVGIIGGAVRATFCIVNLHPTYVAPDAAVELDAAIDAAQSTEMKLTKEKAMQPHQQRVVDEKAELDARREKLTAFLAGDICRTLPAEEQHRLGRQATIMAQYSQILGERIDAF